MGFSFSASTSAAFAEEGLSGLCASSAVGSFSTACGLELGNRFGLLEDLGDGGSSSDFVICFFDCTTVKAPHYGSKTVAVSVVKAMTSSAFYASDPIGVSVLSNEGKLVVAENANFLLPAALVGSPVPEKIGCFLRCPSVRRSMDSRFIAETHEVMDLDDAAVLLAFSFANCTTLDLEESVLVVENQGWDPCNNQHFCTI